MPEVQHRAVNAVREWNTRLGKDAVYLICSHGDVIKSVIADSLGLHLDLSQRIQVDPCSLSVIRYTPLRPFLVRMNDTGRTAAGLARPHDAGAAAGKAAANGAAPQQAAAEAVSRPPFGEGDAAIGGGAGG
jgi:probable phosphoglycerate mutase